MRANPAQVNVACLYTPVGLAPYGRQASRYDMTGVGATPRGWAAAGGGGGGGGGGSGGGGGGGGSPVSPPAKVAAELVRRMAWSANA